MKEKGTITMSQFKTIVENFHSDIKKMSEVMQHGFEAVNAEFRYVKADIRELKGKADLHTGQISRLQEDVTEIKNSLKLKVDREEFAKLEMRVTKLENKVA